MSTAWDRASLHQFADGAQASDRTEDQTVGIADLRTRLLEAATTVTDQLSAIGGRSSPTRTEPALAATWPNCFGLAHTHLLRRTSRSGCRSRSSCYPAALSCASASALVSGSLSPATKLLGREFARVRERMPTPVASLRTSLSAWAPSGRFGKLAHGARTYLPSNIRSKELTACSRPLFEDLRIAGRTQRVCQ